MSTSAIANHIAASYSADGNLLAIALSFSGNQSPDKLVTWSLESRRELWSKSDLSPAGYEFSPDNSRLVAWNRTEIANSIFVYDSVSGRELARLRLGDTENLSISALGPELMSLDEAGDKIMFRTEHTVYIWDTNKSSPSAALNVFAEDQAQRKTDNARLSSSNPTNVVLDIAKRKLNSCPN